MCDRRAARKLDSSLLLGALMDYPSERDPRLNATITALRRELGSGPLLNRYSGEDGLGGTEGAFLCCSFWLADALARADRIDKATELMEQLIGLANDVGLYSEEVDHQSGEFLGNMPQGLVHLALINAAVSIGDEATLMSIWGAIAGGFVGTLVLTTALSAASGFGLTRMDLPFLLGTIVSSDRGRAKALGYAMHFATGLLFGMVYLGIFAAIGESGWGPGGLVRPRPRPLRRHGPGNRGAPRHSPPNGHAVQRRP